MSESAENTRLTPGDAPLDPRIHLGSTSDDPANRDPTSKTPSQSLLEALQNFVIPLKNKKDISHIDVGLEAEKLVIALQELILSMIKQTRVGHLQGVEVNLEVPNVDDVPSNDAKFEFPGVAIDSAVFDIGPVEEDSAEAESPDVGIDNPGGDPGLLEDGHSVESPDTDTNSTVYYSLMSSIGTEAALLEGSELKASYHTLMGKIPEAVRERVFSKMPIRVLHFTNTSGDSGTKLQITLLDRNSVCTRAIEEIQANYSERLFGEAVGGYRHRRGETPKHLRGERSIEDDIIEELVRENTKYAILSHTWLRGSDSEVTYAAWQTGQFDIQQPGYQKLADFCKSAWKDHGLSFGWMDTVCINKDSSSELDESIRSMNKWYMNSDICITYLAGTVTLSNIHLDPWFTRGWTFQELLAPERMSFYSKVWKKFVSYTHPGDKSNTDIQDQIFKATTITADELHSPNSMRISRKMQLAAGRKVVREEDTAYSLMGICGVSISIAYGEGAERAFFRLMTEILNSSPTVVDIFNCAQMRDGRSIIPLSPSAYLRRSEAIMEMVHYPPLEPLLLTHVGLRMPVLLMPSLREDDPCLKNKPIGDYHAIFHLPTLSSPDIGPYYLLDKGIAINISNYRRTFGILNFSGDTTSIYVPDRCLAVCFQSQGRVEWDSTSSEIERIGTREPIVLHLMHRRISTSGEGRYRFPLKRGELAKHGMTLATMYL